MTDQERLRADLERVTRERDAMRAALRETVAVLGGGTSDEVSDEFLLRVPGDVASAVRERDEFVVAWTRDTRQLVRQRNCQTRRAEQSESLLALAMVWGAEAMEFLSLEEDAADDAEEQYDLRIKQIEDIHAVFGCEREWSNLHDLGDCAEHMARDAVAEVHSLRRLDAPAQDDTRTVEVCESREEQREPLLATLHAERVAGARVALDVCEYFGIAGCSADFAWTEIQSRLDDLEEQR